MEESNIFVEIAKSVYDQLGPGHSESSYHKAYSAELNSQGYSSTCERNIVVTYTDSDNNTHFLNSERIDVFIHKNEEKNIGNIIIELKAINRTIGNSEITQLKKYQRQLKKENIDYEYGLVINFPPCMNSKGVESVKLV